MERKAEQTVVLEFSDDAVTGNFPLHERRGGGKLVKRIKAGAFDAVWTVHIDCLTRSESMAEREAIFDLLKGNGVALITPEDAVKWFDTSTSDPMYSLKS